MRILFFADNFKPETNAPATHIYERCKIWVAQGHQVTVITCAPNFPEGRVYPGFKNRWRSVETLDGIRVVRVKTFISANEGFVLRTLDFLSYFPSALFFSFFEAKPDVVIASSPQLFVAVAGIVYGMLRRVPRVFELRDLWPASILATTGMQPGFAYRMLERLELFLYRHSTRIASLTESFVGELTARGVPRDKIDVVINGANLDLFQPQASKDRDIERQFGLENRFVVGYLGTLGLAHGLTNVLDAAALLGDRPITFFFVGGGADRAKLEAMTAERNLNNVIFAPRQEKSQMPRFWSVCDASLVHLHNAPLFATVIPSKIFETMAVGLPIVYVGPAGEGSRIVARHDAGLLVPPADPQALADAVCQLVADEQLRRRLAANALAAAPNYSRQRQADDTLAVLQRAIESKLA